MKTVEEKAKAYDEALERARKEYKIYESVNDVFHCEALERIFRKLADSEDEKIRKDLIRIVSDWKEGHYTWNSNIEYCDRVLAWLKKQGEQKPAWSEEDENGLGDALWCCEQAASIAKDENDMGNAWYAKRWLKSLKERVKPQPKQEWNKTDEEKLDRIISIIHCYTGTVQEEVMLKNWLKSLRPQKHWKPSEEQMDELKYAYIHKPYSSEVLETLYNDLKEL